MHPKQLEIYHDSHRFKIAQCGRRFGKTQLAWIQCLVFMVNHPKCLLWWVAPIYKELIPATKTVRDLTPKRWVSKQHENSETIRYIKLFNGSECFFHSADREDSLRGSGIHGLVVDEAPILKQSRWDSELKPSLIDFNGWALFIGTPRGTTWFTKLFTRGQDPTDMEYKSWQLSSYSNSIEQGGFLPKANIDAIAKDMPEMLKRQEIYAETLEGEGVVFRHIADRIRDNVKPYQPGEVIVTGSDIAKTVDYYVNVALRLNGEVVGFDRFNKIDYPFARKRTVEFCKRLNSFLLIDSTGVGEPVHDELKREYPQVQGYKLTNPTKKALIENLSIMLDNGEIWFPGNLDRKEFSPELQMLKSELESFAYDLSPSGLIRYGAPEGLHDDCVIALALAAYQLKNIPRDVEPAWVFGD
jgi:hypothetical protein